MPPKVDVPILKDLTIDNITENVHRINSQSDDARLKYVLERLVSHMHDFARETRLSTNEWLAGIQFLTDVGKKCTDVRQVTLSPLSFLPLNLFRSSTLQKQLLNVLTVSQEFILLSDTLGLSLLVDSIDHPKPPSSTEGTVLGPYHTHDAKSENLGTSISADPDGEELLCICTVKSTSGSPIPGVKIDVWETDSHGSYDVQYEHYSGEKPDGRAVLRSDDEGVFWYKAIVPVPYSIPDGAYTQGTNSMSRHLLTSYPDFKMGPWARC
jgi:hypothetical protein